MRLSRPLPVEDEERFFIRMRRGKEGSHDESKARLRRDYPREPSRRQSNEQEKSGYRHRGGNRRSPGAYTADDKGRQAVAATSGMKIMRSEDAEDVAALSASNLSYPA